MMRGVKLYLKVRVLPYSTQSGLSACGETVYVVTLGKEEVV